MLTDIVHTFRTCIRFIEQAVADLNEQQMVQQPVGIPNHATWTLGHVTHSCEGITVELGGQPWLPDNWEATFGYGSIPSAQVSDYLPKSAMVQLLQDSADRLCKFLESLDESVLNKPYPDERFVTAGQLLMQVAIGHTAYHAGQLQVWRRALDLPSAGVFI